MPKILENVRENILKEAKEMLINSNYESFNIRELSNKCNISIGTIYNYYPNKYELVSSIFYEDWNNSVGKMANINSNYSTLKEKLYALYIEIKDFLNNYLSIFKEIGSSSSSDNTSCLTHLYPILEEIIVYEKSKGNITSTLPNEKLYLFITNILIMLCNDDSLTFDEAFSLISL